MTIIKTVSILLSVPLLAWAAGLAWLSFTSVPPEVRLVDGHLRACPETPNCVSSESAAPAAHIEPLRFKGAPQAAWSGLRSSIRALGGTIVEEQEGVLWATFTSRIFRFVDDMECRMVVEEGVIHLRSASRAGWSDMGVNRERVERLRRLFDQRQGGVKR